jgi:hypothetical protein
MPFNMQCQLLSSATPVSISGVRIRATGFLLLAEPETSSQKPVTRDQRPVASDQKPI